MLPIFDDDLIDLLAEFEATSAAQRAETTPLAQVQVELVNLSARLRHPDPVDPYRDESSCQDVVDRAANLVLDVSQATVTEFTEQGIEHAPTLSILGQYRLLSMLGRGGMGAVYRALHTKLDRVVALKILSASRLKDPQSVSRFEREMRAVGKLQHPNIVAAHDAGEIDGTHYLSMELVEGFDLAAIAHYHGPLPIAAACEIVRQAANGLQHAHEHGLVHRDIKPSNVMLVQPTTPDGAPGVKVLDLGLALLEEGHVAGEITSTGQVLGTIDYMAPEQGSDTHQVDIRADIYSLGAMLYKLITGSTPHASPRLNTTIKKLMALATEEPPAVLDLRPDCPAELANVIHQMLAKSPQSRPASPAAVADSLAPFTQGADLWALLETMPTKPIEPIHGSMGFGRDAEPIASVDTKIPLATDSSIGIAHVQSQRMPIRRWFTALGILTVLVVCGVIILVSTDQGTIMLDVPVGMETEISVNVLRDGNPITTNWSIKPGTKQTTVRSGRIEVTLPADQRDEFEVISPQELIVRRGKELTFKIQRRLSGNGIQTAVDSTVKNAPVVSKPLDIPEPPPFDEWMKGREVLTVAQDGRGEFKTIQAALQALQTGQVVKVLDRGPYRENLTISDLPEDSGLVSEADTILESTEWVHAWTDAPSGREFFRAHVFQNMNGFRVHGLVLVFRSAIPQHTYGLLVENAEGLVFENCYVREGPSYGTEFKFREGIIQKPVYVRECRFESSLNFIANTTTSEGMALVVRNYFSAQPRTVFGFGDGGRWSKIVIRNNIMDGGNGSIHIGQRVLDALEISNNLLDAATGITFATSLPTGDVIICNNLRSQAGLTLLMAGAEQKLPEAIRRFQVGNNCFLRNLVSDNDSIGYFPNASTDILGAPRYLSKVPFSANYLRVAADDPIVRRGAGGDWPDYIGPLPPGPAPKEGDWFSRLREKWPSTGVPDKTTSPSESSLPVVTKPLEIPEPPSLDEWIKGREILTVAQDGSGQFKTIQSALNALQTGQVVKVLDRGPYRENLDAKDLPEDTGLVSESGTVLEATKWTYSWTAKEIARDNFRGQMFFYVSGFRISGFTLTFPPSDDKYTAGIEVARADGLVFENCHVCEGPTFGANFSFREGVIRKPAIVRECRFESGLACYAGTSSQGQILIARNYFPEQRRSSLAIGVGHWSKVAIRNNILEGGDGNIYTASKDLDFLEISNNLLNTDWAMYFETANPQGAVAICNNLRSKAGLVVLGGAEQNSSESLRRWHIGNNCYLRELKFEAGASETYVPPAATDILGAPRYLSKVQSGRDYLRIAPDDPIARKGLGGDWPDYIGPLPPGPSPKEGDWFTRLRERWPELSERSRDAEKSRSANGTRKHVVDLTESTSAVLRAPDWPLGVDDEWFPGLVARPVKLPDVHRWQLATRFPRSALENVAWNPDGDHIVCCGLDELVRIYNVDSMRLIRAWPARTVRAIDWSPDGKLIAAGGYEQNLHLWNAEDGTTHAQLKNHGERFENIHAVAFSPDSKFVAFASLQDRSVRLWNSGTGDQIRRFVHPQPVWDVAWSPDGLKLATVCADGIVRLWETATAKVVQEFIAEGSPGRSLAFSAEGKQVIATDEKQRVRAWNVESKAEERSWERGGCSVAVSKLGTVAAVGLVSTEIHLWDLATGTKGPTCVGHDLPFQGRHSIKFSRDGNRLVSVNQDGSIRIWNPKTGECTGVVGAHSWQSNHLEFDSTGKSLGSAGLLNVAAHLWNVSDGTLRVTLKPAGSRSVRWLAFSPDGKEVVTCGGQRPFAQEEGTEDHSVRIWNSQDGTAGPVLDGHVGKVCTLAWSHDGRRIASGGWDRHIRIWNRTTSKAERLIAAGVASNMLAFSPDGKKLASMGWPNSLRFWDLETGTIGPQVELKAGDGFEAVTFHPHRNEIATVEYEVVRIRDVATGNVIRDILPSHATTAAISPNGKLLAAVDDMSMIHVFHYETGLLVHQMQNHYGDCRGLAFSPDSRLLSVGSGDGTIRLWDTQTFLPLRVTLSFLGNRFANITPAGQLLMEPAAAEEEMVYLIQAREGASVEMLTPREFQDRYGKLLPEPTVNAPEVTPQKD